MANPNLRNYSQHRNHIHGLVLPTADTFENVIGNPAGSGFLLEVDFWFWSRDAASDFAYAVELYAGAGTPICNHTGVTAITTGTDALGTAALGGPVAMPSPSGLGNQMIRRVPLPEGYSIAVKPVGTGSGNKVALWMAWSAITDA